MTVKLQFDAKLIALLRLKRSLLMYWHCCIGIQTGADSQNLRSQVRTDFEATASYLMKFSGGLSPPQPTILYLILRPPASVRTRQPCSAICTRCQVAVARLTLTTFPYWLPLMSSAKSQSNYCRR